jgi:hypothetical protein
MINYLSKTPVTSIAGLLIILWGLILIGKGHIDDWQSLAVLFSAGIILLFAGDGKLSELNQLISSWKKSE